MCKPQHCQFGEWADWSLPTCLGLCERERVIKEENNKCGTPCSGSLHETKTCLVWVMSASLFVSVVVFDVVGGCVGDGGGGVDGCGVADFGVLMNLMVDYAHAFLFPAADGRHG